MDLKGFCVGMCFGVTLMASALVNCAKDRETSVNESAYANQKYSVTTMKVEDLVHISGDLYYDDKTHVVYLWEGPSPLMDSKTAPVPYISYTGLTHKYNLETGEIYALDFKDIIKEAIAEYEAGKVAVD